LRLTGDLKKSRKIWHRWTRKWPITERLFTILILGISQKEAISKARSAILDNIFQITRPDKSLVQREHLALTEVLLACTPGQYLYKLREEWALVRVS
jgi:hypothetical protein